MATVNELSQPFANYLLPVLAAGDDVCSICHSAKHRQYQYCFQCSRALQTLPSTADALGFVGLAVKGEQFARDLAVYKDKRPEASSRVRLGLSAVLWRWLDRHESCVAAAAKVTSFPIVTSVPSVAKPSEHPLEWIVGTSVDLTKSRYRATLRARPDVDDGHVVLPDRFEVVDGVDPDCPILLIDDTFTMGSRVQSAAAVLKAAGSGPVGVVCLGRHFAVGDDPRYRTGNEEYLRRSKQQRWSWDICCLCT